MTCTRGCCPTQAQHYRSLTFGQSQPAEHRRWDQTLDDYRKVRDGGGQPPTVDAASEYLRAVGG